MAAAERQRITVEQDDSRDFGGTVERLARDDACTERMADQQWMNDLEPPLEAVQERQPTAHRRLDVALRVAERRQVESEHAMTRRCKTRPDRVPHPGRFGGAAEQHD